jgi:VanZ like family
MPNGTNFPSAPRFLPITCIAVALILLGVGLWPFNPFPRNQVTWLTTENGVEFGDHGVIFSSGSFIPPEVNGASCSLEIRLQPRIKLLHNSATLLVFYAPNNPLQFRLMQYRDELLIRKSYRDASNKMKSVEIELEHAFAQDVPVSFLVTSGPHGSVAYRNGIRAGASKRMELTCADFSGQLVLGDSAISDNPFQGRLTALAIYQREVTPAEISSAYAASSAEAPLLKPADDDRMIARYTFAEGSGKIIHNRAGAAPDLYIPRAFRLLHQPFLTAPWKEFAFDRPYAIDVAINVAGFVPFGFILYAYLSWQRRWNRAAILTILAGAAISLNIEVLQSFLPSRFSGVTDLITNTLGTALGVALFRWGPVHTLVSKFLSRFVPPAQTIT